MLDVHNGLFYKRLKENRSLIKFLYGDAIV